MESRKLLYDYLIENTSLSDKEAEMICSYTETEELKKGDYFQKEGCPVTRFGFLCNGLVKEEITNPNGRKCNNRFIWQGKFLTDYGGYLFKQPARYGLCAIIPSKVLFITIRNIEMLKGYIPTLGNVLESLACRTLVEQKYEGARVWLFSLKERYCFFTKAFRDIDPYLSESDRASYLHITLSSFSRFKRNYFRSLRRGVI